MANKLPLKQQLEQFKKERTAWAGTIGMLAKKQFTDNFNKGGFDGQKWKPRKPTKNKRDVGRAILVKSGVLKRSITSRVNSWNRITIGSYTPYSRVHNEGSKKMPQRKFIGDSKILDKKVLDFVTKKMNGIFKK